MTNLVPEAVSALRVWNAAIRIQVFTIHQLSAEASFCHKRVGNLIREWEEQGLLERTSAAQRNNRASFRMANDGRLPQGMDKNAKVKRQESLRGNMWLAMRVLGSFTPRDIAATAVTENTNVSMDDAAAYCRFLAKGSEPHLRVLKKSKPGVSEPQYRLIRNTGPLPPRERRIRATYDPNLDAFTHLGGPN